MTCFRDFTAPLWKLFGGNTFLVVTIAFYIAWWAVSFRPNRNSTTAGAGLFLAVAFLTGLAAIAMLFLGISALSQVGKGIPLIYILPGVVAIYLLLLAVTQIAFHRVVTSELLLITVWAVMEGSAIAVLQGSGRFSLRQTLTLATLVLLATGVGLVCYILHYRLDEIPRFWNGIIPLAVDAGVVAVFLAMLAFS